MFGVERRVLSTLYSVAAPWSCDPSRTSICESSPASCTRTSRRSITFTSLTRSDNPCALHSRCNSRNFPTRSRFSFARRSSRLRSNHAGRTPAFDRSETFHRDTPHRHRPRQTGPLRSAPPRAVRVLVIRTRMPSGKTRVTTAVRTQGSRSRCC